MAVRPIELTLEGFRSYRGTQTFNFDGRGLFGIVGATGAGKSSILDAIIYALYGKTPTVERDTHTLINSSDEEARLSLHFEVDGRVWEVNRVIRAKGQAQVVLKRDDGSLEATGARAVTDQINELVGLDFSAFCSSVVLPQGSFDDFLKATPSKRTRILKGLFRLERVDLMRTRAKELLDELLIEGKALQARLEQMPADPEAQLETLTSGLAAAKKRAADLEKASERISALVGEVERKGRDLEIKANEEEAVRSARSQIPEPADVEALVSAEEQIRRLAQELQVKKTKASGDVAEASKTLVSVEKTLGAELHNAADLLRDFKRSSNSAEAAAARLDETKKAFELATASLEAQQRVSATADREVEQARSRLEEGRKAHAAHLLRADLKKGEQCPVCEQEVKLIPKAGKPAGMTRLEQALDKVIHAFEKSKKALDQLVRDHSGAQAHMTATDEQRKSAVGERDDAARQLTAILGKDLDFDKEIERRRLQIRRATEFKDRADQELRDVEKQLAETKDRLDDTADLRRRVAASLIQICMALAIEPPSIDDDADAILGAAKRAAEAATLRISELAKSKSDLESSIASTRVQIDSVLGNLGIEPGLTVSQGLSKANEEVGGLGVRIEELKQTIKLLAEITKRAKVIDERVEVYRRLTTDLTDSRFTAYLLDEQKRLLSRLGSEKFYELTQRYRFDEEGNFQIHDVGIGVLRPPDTLSGGETFLASLALALGLAEAVSEGGSRLDCFFLDEGFGSLDRNSLDLALDGIESLATPGRLIGLISHVPEIQARLDDLIVLDKNDDGSTRVLQSDGPIGYHTPLL